MNADRNAKEGQYVDAVGIYRQMYTKILPVAC